MTYYVLGIEPFNTAEIRGMHESKKKAVSQAQYLEKNKNSLCCQIYKVFTNTEIKRRKIKLYA